MDSVSASFVAVLVVGGFFLAIAWIALPFAMFGIKPLLREMIDQQRIANQYLKALQSAEQDAATAEAVAQISSKSIEITAPWEK